MNNATADAPTSHRELLAWVEDMAALCRPAAIHWCDGSEAERDALYDQLVAAGTFIKLDAERRPGSYLCRSDPADVARVEDRTFICSADAEDAGPTNNWRDPDLMKHELRELFAGCMRGRTMYVVPFAMGPLGSPVCTVGVQVTDSPYVVVNTRIMARMGSHVLEHLGNDGTFVPCAHSVGWPLTPGHDSQGPVWPCDPDHKYICHFPEDPAIWSYGSGYGGNALLGKKCLALRIASTLAREHGWMAEHMLILRLIDPAGRHYHIAAAFPSACGKTNLAMLQPTLPGWRVECIGDDIAWLHIDDDGRLRAVNPEAGFFGVAPGTSQRTNPMAMRTLDRDALFTNVALTDDGDVWWEGMTPEPPARCIDWQGHVWTPGSERPAAHPNARYTVAAEQCPVLCPDWNDPAGVPLDAIVFGGRRADTVPLVHQAEDWQHAVYLGTTCASETTAAAAGARGKLRRDPFAMRPFCGYNIGDYCEHWLDMGRRLGPAAPPVFYVNWFRKGAAGGYLWPGFGDNIRVLAWICARAEGRAKAADTPIGAVPRPEDLELAGLDLEPAQLDELLHVDPADWQHELASTTEFLNSLGRHIPRELLIEHQRLHERVVKRMDTHLA